VQALPGPSSSSSSSSVVATGSDFGRGGGGALGCDERRGGADCFWPCAFARMGSSLKLVASRALSEMPLAVMTAVLSPDAAVRLRRVQAVRSRDTSE